MRFPQRISWKIFDLRYVRLILGAPNIHSISLGQRKENTIFSHGIWAGHFPFSVFVSLSGKMVGLSQKFSPPVKFAFSGSGWVFDVGVELSSSSWVADAEGEPLCLTYGINLLSRAKVGIS